MYATHVCVSYVCTWVLSVVCVLLGCDCVPDVCFVSVLCGVTNDCFLTSVTVVLIFWILVFFIGGHVRCLLSGGYGWYIMVVAIVNSVVTLLCATTRLLNIETTYTCGVRCYTSIYSAVGFKCG